MPRVAVLVTVTFAPGIGAPDESVTVPLIPPCVCARPVTTQTARNIATLRTRATERDLCIIILLQMEPVPQEPADNNMEPVPPTRKKSANNRESSRAVLHNAHSMIRLVTGPEGRLPVRER